MTSENQHHENVREAIEELGLPEVLRVVALRYRDRGDVATFNVLFKAVTELPWADIPTWTGGDNADT